MFKPTVEDLDRAPVGTKVQTGGWFVDGEWWIKVDPEEYMGLTWKGLTNPNRIIGKKCLAQYAIQMEVPKNEEAP